MSLPELTPLQFLVLQLLFAGPQGGKDLRRKAKAAGAALSPPSFSRLMHRMNRLGYLQIHDVEEAERFRYVLPRRFELTDLGLALWRRTREFYTRLSDPPDGLKPIVTENGKLAHLSRKERRRVVRRRVRRQARRIIEKALGLE
jgi:hypothetical protein